MPPGPVSVSNRVSAQRLARDGQLGAANEARQLDGQVVRPRVQRAQWRKPVFEALDHELVQPFRGGQVLEPLLAKIAQLDSSGKCRHQSPGGL